MVTGTLVVPFAIPLSPPHSPPMSDAGYKSEEHNAQQGTGNSAIARHDSTFALEGASAVAPLENADTFASRIEPTARPPLRSYKSFPYSLGPSSRVQDETSSDPAATNVLADFAERVLSSGPQPTASANLQQPTFGGSAPASPAGQFSPSSPKVEEQGVPIEDEDIELGDAEDDDGTVERRPMTAAELRAHKRKMKRFRLTHNQTRFLMSEFARQAHPDAAHRERLSREIPGLSPRQVQVWFQNRRAKLKRLTTDDRERMMRSRALPADFDTTQALHSPFSTPNPSMTAPVASTATFPSFNNSTGMRPLSLDTMRRPSDYETYHPKYPSASSAIPALGGSYAFTPPQSATETMSPGSAAGPVSNLNFQTQESPRRTVGGLPYGAQPSFATPANTVPPRLHIHDRVTRVGVDVAGSPLRSSMSYGMGANIVSETRTERSSSVSDHAYTHERPQRSRSNTASSMTGAGPYGLGFSYSNMTMYPQVDQIRAPQTTPSSAEFQQPRRGGSHLAGMPLAYSQYPAANLSTSQMSHYLDLNAGYIASNFHGGYQYQASDIQQRPGDNQSQISQQTSQSYTPVQAQAHHLLPFSTGTSQQESQGDSSEGNVPLNLNY